MLLLFMEDDSDTKKPLQVAVVVAAATKRPSRSAIRMRAETCRERPVVVGCSTARTPTAIATSTAIAISRNVRQ